MKFTLTIDCGNDAFCDNEGQCTIDSAQYEIARILRSISARIDENGLSGMFENIKDIDGSPIVGIAINSSTNRKTGGLIQCYIIKSDTSPLDASKSGADVSICGSCKLCNGTKSKGKSIVIVAHGSGAKYA